MTHTTNAVGRSLRLPLCVAILFGGAILNAQEPALKVTEADARQAAINRHDPEYPALARQMKISGKTTVEVTIDDSGKVEQCQAVAGNPVLAGAAVKAVKTWTFKPFTADGKPSKAVARLNFTFGG